MTTVPLKRVQIKAPSVHPKQGGSDTKHDRETLEDSLLNLLVRCGESVKMTQRLVMAAHLNGTRDSIMISEVITKSSEQPDKTAL